MIGLVISRLTWNIRSTLFWSCCLPRNSSTRDILKTSVKCFNPCIGSVEYVSRMPSRVMGGRVKVHDFASAGSHQWATGRDKVAPKYSVINRPQRWGAVCQFDIGVGRLKQINTVPYRNAIVFSCGIPFDYSFNWTRVERVTHTPPCAARKSNLESFP